MQQIKTAFDIATVADHGVRKLIQQRYAEVFANEDDASTADITFFVVEPKDELEELENATGCPIVTSWFSNAVYPDKNFVPCFEFVEEHRCCFEMVFVLNDDSSTVVILVPKQQVINALLLKLCSEFANEVVDAEV